MKKFTLSVLTLATIASSLVFTSCEKDEEDSKSKTELLTARNWRVSADVAVFTNGTTTNTQDIYATYPACEKDDYAKFETNKVVKFDEGPIRCGSTQSVNGSWDFNSGETSLLITDPSQAPSTTTYELLQLTESTLQVRIATSLNGIAGSRTTTYTAF